MKQLRRSASGLEFVSSTSQEHMNRDGEPLQMMKPEIRILAHRAIHKLTSFSPATNASNEILQKTSRIWRNAYKQQQTMMKAVHSISSPLHERKCL
jgi:hypothetical protein